MINYVTNNKMKMDLNGIKKIKFHSMIEYLIIKSKLVIKDNNNFQLQINVHLRICLPEMRRTRIYR